jgi:hypothetical protein
MYKRFTNETHEFMLAFLLLFLALTSDLKPEDKDRRILIEVGRRSHRGFIVSWGGGGGGVGEKKVVSPSLCHISLSALSEAGWHSTSFDGDN